MQVLATRGAAAAYLPKALLPPANDARTPNACALRSAVLVRLLLDALLVLRPFYCRSSSLCQFAPLLNRFIHEDHFLRLLSLHGDGGAEGEERLSPGRVGR